MIKPYGNIRGIQKCLKKKNILEGPTHCHEKTAHEKLALSKEAWSVTQF